MNHINQGLRLTPPAHTNPTLAKIMSSCWQHRPEDRITFTEIRDTLHILQYES